ncbi:MAG: WD40 repeat domain-containing protein, partial [Leptolyngbya sp. SIO1D8]|nr:WD40 repeat domain-containing protein [Leptolyngbya sp. SIO1D8]
MSSVKPAVKLQFTPQQRHTLSDYVTAIAWSPQADWLAAASAAGEVMVYRLSETPVMLRSADGQAVNCLHFSANGQFLAAGGQSGHITVWDIQSPDISVVFQQSHPSYWVDKLAWHPHQSVLAYGVGSQVQIWQVSPNTAIAELDFLASSVLHLAWHPHGTYLAVSGHGGIQAWLAEDWQADP